MTDTTCPLEQIQALAIQAAESRNADVDEYNQIIDILEQRDAEIAVLDSKLSSADAKLTASITESGQLEIDLSAAQGRISSLNNTVDNLNSIIADYKLLSPERMKKQLHEVKTKNQKLLANNEAVIRRIGIFKDRNKELAGLLDRVRQGFWQEGKERLISQANSTMITNASSGKTFEYKNSVWWAHERGIHLLCAYDVETDDVLISDPMDENDMMLVPSEVAQQAMKKYFRANHKHSLK